MLLTRLSIACVPSQIHDNAGLLELPSEREAHVRRAGGESRSDTVGDGQPGVRGLRTASAGHATHQSGVVRRKRPGKFRRVISRSFPHVGCLIVPEVVSECVPRRSGGRQFPEISGQRAASVFSHDYYIVLLYYCNVTCDVPWIFTLFSPKR